MTLYKVWDIPKPWAPVIKAPRVIYISSSRDAAIQFLDWCEEEDHGWCDYRIEAERRSYYGVTL